MRLLKQQRTWLFVAALRFFAKARSIVDRKCMAAGDYQLDSEIATRNSYLSNYGKDPSAAWRFLCHAPQTAASGWTPVLRRNGRQRRRCADSGRSRSRYRTAQVDPLRTLAPDFCTAPYTTSAARRKGPRSTRIETQRGKKATLP